MQMDGYYSSGEFARLAGVTVRTIRYYDKTDLLKPSVITDSGARFYSDSDLARLQQILLLKFLGFSLDDIREITIGDSDSRFLRNSLQLQRKLIEDRIEQMELVRDAISDAEAVLKGGQSIDWSSMLDLIHLTGMEKSMASQYRNASNLSARIRLHTRFSVNQQHWFPWLFEQLHLKDGMRILELGCGSGSLWSENLSLIPADCEIILSDISDGMIRDARRNIGVNDPRFSYSIVDCMNIPEELGKFDLITANHVLFYAQDPSIACQQIAGALKKDGKFICSSYGSAHMKEITSLVQEYDNRIVLSADHLYDRFGLENGTDILSKWFTDIQLYRYDDHLLVDEAGPLIEYILSCHGNQSQFILDHYKEFQTFVQNKTRNGFRITKDAGVFIASS